MFGALSTRGVRYARIHAADLDALAADLEAKGVGTPLGPEEVPPVNVRDVVGREMDGNQVGFVELKR